MCPAQRIEMQLSEVLREKQWQKEGKGQGGWGETSSSYAKKRYEKPTQIK